MRASLWRRRARALSHDVPLGHRQHGSGRKFPSTRRCPSPATDAQPIRPLRRRGRARPPGGRRASGDRRWHIFGHSLSRCD